MKLYLIISRKNLSIILSILIAVTVSVGMVSSLRLKRIDGSTNEVRTEYLKRLKIGVDDSGVTAKEITIPENFSGVYKQYNEVQKKSGFDLSRYKGKTVTLYSYPIIGDNKKAELLVYKNSIIGGSIVPDELGQPTEPLKK